MKDTIVVNLSGAPGAGKSTGAAYIFSCLKMRGVDAELVTEYAKDKVWEENPTPFKNQAYIFAQQYYKLTKVVGKVDVVVTDSPLILSTVYNTDERLGKSFDEMVMHVFNSYNNVNYFLNRIKPYNNNGRFQSSEESDRLSEIILDLYKENNIPVKIFNGCRAHYDLIVQDIIDIINTEE